MQQISLYLEAFKSIGLEGELFKEVVAEAVKKYTGIILEKKNVTVKDNTIYLSISPGGKSEVFMKRDKISEYVVEKMGKKKGPSIR